MDIKDFIAGKYVKQIAYSSFLPENISKEWVISSPKMNSLLTEANRLSEGGKIQMSPTQTFWGSYFDILTDRFGINWMVSTDSQD